MQPNSHELLSPKGQGRPWATLASPRNCNSLTHCLARVKESGDGPRWVSTEAPPSGGGARFIIVGLCFLAKKSLKCWPSLGLFTWLNMLRGVIISDG